LVLHVNGKSRWKIQVRKRLRDSALTLPIWVGLSLTGLVTRTQVGDAQEALSTAAPQNTLVSTSHPSEEEPRSKIAPSKETTSAPKSPSQSTTDKKTGSGKIEVSSILQLWAGTAFGDGVAGVPPGVKRPPGRNYGGDGGDLLRLRRAQVALHGYLSDPVDYRIMFDLARTTPGASNRHVLQDYWVGYRFNPHWRAEFGQQKTGLSEEGSRSNSEQLTIARSIMNEDLPAKAGRIGDIRDLGLVFRYRDGKFNGLVGLWNDNGAAQNRLAFNSRKFLDGAVYFTGIPHATFGLWGGTNIGGSLPAEARDRAGGTFVWHRGPNYFEMEVVYARDYAAGAPGPGLNGSMARGGYLLYARSLSRQWQLVARYDNWDPAQQSGDAITETGVKIPQADHKLREYTLGINYYVPRSDAKIQLNYIREDTEVNGAGFFGKQRSILLTNFQWGFHAPARWPDRERADAPEGEGHTLGPTDNGIRLGLVALPQVEIAGGIDLELPRFPHLPGFRSRLTAEALARFDAPSFGGFPGTIYVITLDQATTVRLNRGHKLYVGFGLGSYYEIVNRLGGKLFLGGSLTRTLGAELSVHFPGAGKTLMTLQARIPL
jgi:hypothetical protein